MALIARRNARLESLDIVRGVAVMGILTMNIVAFAMPEAAYTNPAAYGGARGADLWAYLANFVLFDGKMRGLFSFLFGASLLLVAERAEAAGRNPARVHYARMAWLFVFGLAHFWLLWWGDILTLYALVGMLAFPFRHLGVPRLVAAGLTLVAVELALIGQLPLAIDHALTHPGPAARQAIEGYRASFGIPAPERIAEEIALYRSDYPTIVRHRIAEESATIWTTAVYTGAETLGYMLLGMAALKSGMLAGRWRRRRYAAWALAGFGIGIPAYLALGSYLVGAGFSIAAVALAVLTLPILVRPAMIAGWACLILLLARPEAPLTRRIAATGRMAFTNYLATSLICTTLFYGYGLGWFGYLTRAELYCIVPFVWTAMLLWSAPWLERFRYGPFEWLWRSLARWRLQPMRPGPAIIANATQ